MHCKFLPLAIAALFYSCGVTSGEPPFATSGDVDTTIPANTTSPLGSNISPLESWTPGWVFVDFFPKSTSWVSNVCDSGTWGQGDTLTTDSNGWVTALPAGTCADTHVMFGLGTHYPAGTYVLLWEGDGTFDIRNDVSPAVGHTMGSTPEKKGDLNRMTFAVDAANQQGLGIGLHISALDSDYLRNFRMIAPGGVCGESMASLDLLTHCQTSRGGTGSCAGAQTCYDFEEVYWDRFTGSTSDMDGPKVVFHPTWLANYRGYSTIRFMKWSRVEDLSISEWSERVSLTRAQFPGDEVGVPLEYQLAMATILRADAWLHIPVNASEDYVINMAALAGQMLPSSLRVFIEYANELFNSAQARGYVDMLALANAGTVSVNSSDSDLTKAAKAASSRSVSKINTFANAFGTSKTVRTLAGFHANTEFSSAMVNFENATSQIDAYAVAPYLGPDRRYVDDQVLYDSMTEDNLFQEIFNGNFLNSGSSLSDHNTYIQNAMDLMASSNIPVITYEGGTWFDSTGTTADAFNSIVAAHRSSRMADAYNQLLNNWRNRGGQLFVHFNQEDLWATESVAGAIRYQEETRADSPKFNALMEYIENRPCSDWNRCN